MQKRESEAGCDMTRLRVRQTATRLCRRPFHASVVFPARVVAILDIPNLHGIARNP